MLSMSYRWQKWSCRIASGGAGILSNGASDTSNAAALRNLASFRNFSDRVAQSWPAFLSQRQQRLVQQERHGAAPEKVAENIVEDFLTAVLDWSLSELNNQLQYADIVLTKLGIKRLLIEVKRPGLLKWDQRSLESALSQARRYADEQRVSAIAVSDGTLFYAADIVHGGLRDRARFRLDSVKASLDAWWVSVDGIYRSPMVLDRSSAAAATPAEPTATRTPEINAALIHPKYKIPAQCFAYVGDASDTRTWKLPCRNADGTVDERRLPGAIRAVTTNYRGARATIPEAAIPNILARLGKAAAEARKLPEQTPSPSKSYKALHEALYQLGRLDEVLSQQ